VRKARASLSPGASEKNPSGVMEPDADAEQARLEEKGTRGYLETHTEKLDARSPRARRRRVAPRARFPALE